MNIDYYGKTAQATGEDFEETLRTVVHMTGNFECDEEELKRVKAESFHTSTQPGVSLSLEVWGWLKDSLEVIDGEEYIEPALLAIEVFPQNFDTLGYPNQYTIMAVEIYWDYDEVDAYWELDKLKKRCYQDVFDFWDDVDNIRYMYDGLTVGVVSWKSYTEDRITETFSVPEFDIIEAKEDE